jgi:class 3 adenylate cyclase
MTIFRKFVAKDVAQKAYREREVRLEGAPRNLAILFSDIKSFTYMTETLGTGIINLLNMHYERAISKIRDHHGIIGSIIGDALLAVFGTLEIGKETKSLEAIQTAYEIQEVAAALREEMSARREEIIKQRGGLTEEEERIYKAVMIEVGVGIDGGEVFYGNIGSSKRMTNTVIGDNVNSASRLEGLTRIYKVPVICSEYIKEEVTSKSDQYIFVELDQVQVKGKTLGKRVYWPVSTKRLDEDFQKDIDLFGEGLQLYYEGDWAKANPLFKKCNLPVAEVFRSRTRSLKSPQGWNGIWAMKTK